MDTNDETGTKAHAIELGRQGLVRIRIRLSPRDDVDRVLRRYVLPAYDASPQEMREIADALFPHACEQTYGKR
jgi:hypothetical protein